MNAGPVQNNWDVVAKAVKHGRLERRWSIRDACAAAGVSTTTWINAEKGMQLAPLTLVAIAQALEWPEGAMDRLLAGQSIQPSDDDDVVDLTPPPWEELLAAQREVSDGLEEVRDALAQIVQVLQDQRDP